MPRPWSPREIEERIPVVLTRMEDALTELRDLGAAAAAAKWAYERRSAEHAAVYTVAAATAYLSSPGRNREERDARASLTQVAPGVTLAGLKEQHAVDLAEFGMTRDLAANAYHDQRKVIDACETEAKILQTLHVSARAVDAPPARRAA